MSAKNIVMGAAGAGAGDSVYIEDVFSTYTYQGNGSTQTINNGIDLAGKGGMVWVKDRVQTYQHVLWDTERGTSVVLRSDSTAANASFPSSITYNSNGFSLNAAQGNESTDKTVSWTFRKQPKFFDIVTYTGNATSGRQISHSLGSAPGMIIVKRTDAVRNWVCFHRSLGNAGLIKLDQTAMAETASALWYNTTPTSTYFAVNNDVDVNASGGTYVAYIFAHDAGGFGLTGTDNVISCGSFTTDGSSKATINLGYEPQWLMYRPTNMTESWIMVDTMRGMGFGANNRLQANTANAEGNYGDGTSIPTATGFNIDLSVAGGYFASQPYIYIAIRRGPMKVPTDGTKVYNAITRTGTGAVATVTGVGFPPDLAITRARSAGEDTYLTSKLIDPAKFLRSNRDTQEVTDTPSLTSFDMSGITVGPDVSYNRCNGNTIPYINWFFQRAPSFFDEVCYTGTDATQSLSHNLGVIPDLIFSKSRSSAYDWGGLRRNSAGNVAFGMSLNSSLALQYGATYPFSASSIGLTSTKFDPNTLESSAGSYRGGNNIGTTYVAYLFATCAGVSKVGSYTGNGTTQAIACGFAGGARFVLIKRTDAAGDWYSYDTARGIVAGNDPHLSLNTTAAEVTTDDSIDPSASGFIVNQDAATNINVTSATYIFLAIA